MSSLTPEEQAAVEAIVHCQNEPRCDRCPLVGECPGPAQRMRDALAAYKGALERMEKERADLRDFVMRQRPSASGARADVLRDTIDRIIDTIDHGEEARDG